jgi:peptide/nickel transport system permease protein
MKSSTSRAMQVAARLLNTGRPHEAGPILAKIIKIDPRNDQAWYMLSQTLNDRDKQTFALKRVLQINPNNQNAKIQLAKITPAVAGASPGNPNPQAVAVAIPVAAQGVVAVARPAVAFPERVPLAPPARPVSVRHLGARARIRLKLAWQRFKMNWGVFAQSPLAILGVILIFIFAIMAIAHPILMKTVWPRGIYDPATGFDINVFPHPSPPGPGHIFGTDTLGRDVLSMLLAATTPTFAIGLTAAITTAVVGTFLSVVAAYFRGPVDTVITNLADVFLLFPAPVIMVIIGARFRDLGPVPLGLIYGIVTGAGGTAIVMRTHAIQVMSKPFMEAARIAGGNASHIITKHLLPAMLPLAALQMMVAVTGAVVADGFISFFGLTRSTSNWGTIIYEAFVYAASVAHSGTSIWNMLVPAAACFSLFALGFYLVSRGLHRVASPTIREEYG